MASASKSARRETDAQCGAPVPPPLPQARARQKVRSVAGDLTRNRLQQLASYAEFLRRGSDAPGSSRAKSTSKPTRGAKRLRQTPAPHRASAATPDVDDTIRETGFDLIASPNPSNPSKSHGSASKNRVPSAYGASTLDSGRRQLRRQLLLAGVLAIAAAGLWASGWGNQGLGASWSRPAAQDAALAATHTAGRAESRVATTSTPVSRSPETRTYTVAPGDTLGRIAARELGSAQRWREIAAANPQLSDPSRLEVGMTLQLPDGVAKP